MFDIVQKNKTLVQVVLGLVALGLVVTAGVTGYSAMGEDGAYLAKVGNQRITDYDIAEATGRQPISNEMKPMVLEQLVQQKLVLAAANNLNLNASTAQLQQAIAQVPAFQVDGKFDVKRYQDMLAAQGMSVPQFEQRVRDSIVARSLLGAYAGTNILSQTALTRLAKLVGETREVQIATLKAEDFVAGTAVSADEVKKYYDSHQAEFRAPEMVKVEYVALSRQAIADAQQLSDAEVQKYFDDNKKTLAGEERKVSHILIEAAKDAKPEVKQQAKAQAEKLVQELKAQPAKFAELAKQYSKDPGSADNGGDLGWVNAETNFVEPFKVAMLKLPQGQISEPVETDYGYHIIRVDEIKAKSFDELKPQITAQLKSEKADKLYTDQAAQFGEFVYNHADSLKPAAEQFKLQIQQSGWITRQGAQDPQLNNPKLAEAAFSEDVLKGKHNSEPVEVAPGTLVSVRVLEHKPAAQTPLAIVTPDIEAKLKREKAEKVAATEGAKQLAALQAGQTPAVTWAEPKTLGRLGEPGLVPATLQSLFHADAAKLPAYVGAAQPGVGYVIYKVVAAKPAPAMEGEAAKRMSQQLGQMYGQVEVSKYIEDLKKSIKVEYRSKPATE
ncbi:peptidylprolyl isomerase [Chitinolyticbacter meiyuanensis]|uniref:peptidylprolyl isomerase n=1 Tax=Chitinolyticbacter meiyuanensis TaxID=682798 RepID=UPI0011E59C98|nr:peptidylprolyl isomerase [Chitinolyticbacter meiyuanensis]